MNLNIGWRNQFCPKKHDTFLLGRDQSGGCAECGRIARAKWRAKNKDYIRSKQKENDLKYDYGMTIDDWKKMFEEQLGCCAICNKHQSKFKTTLCVDHNHETGKVRGLLCPSCNHLLVALENKDFCLKATLYLEKYS